MMWEDVFNSLYDEIMKERKKERHEARIQILRKEPST